MRGRLDRAIERAYPVPVARFGSQYVIDGVSWTFALVLAILLRFDAAVPVWTWPSLAALVVAAWIAQFGVGWLFHLYRGRFSYGTFEEVRAVGLTVSVTALLLALPTLVLSPLVRLPRSTVFIAVPFALLLMFSARYIKRLYVESRRGPRDDAAPTLIFGAGYLGAALVRRMSTDVESLYSPVGLLDDDPTLRNAQVRHVRVRGTLDDLPSVAETTGATVLVVAIARADTTLMRRVYDIARPLGIDVKVMPNLIELMEGKSRPSDMRDLSIEDLIGRHPVDMRESLVTEYLTGKRVLVTGAGGSIGAELCRQIARLHPAELIMLDRDETGLQTAQIGTAGHGLLHTNDVVLADIRDSAAIDEVFRARRPEVVFHAAALKHLPMLEQYPIEAWKTNVLGTLHTLQAARRVGVSTFVNISTDKAANPTSVLGHSKRIAEKLTAWMGEDAGARYLSVRFGNVLGSRGSMLPTFQALIESGGPVTVTHPEATRYFMTIPEACQLVVQAGGIGDPGEVLILDMGEPVRILDIAEQMIAMSGKDVGIVFTGLRDGEKLHEELLGASEHTDRRVHPKISHARVDGLDPANLDLDRWLRRMLDEPRDRNATATIETGGRADTSSRPRTD
ncbi:nucleoside-diphosphate sugar epimerase/dehydratase [Microbacterium sp.]|jgi:dTDP-glucose 4,6-dehydratase|uniref:polysaccharide biosynthesis protein n=1 Tax=Microbacterium sp. TaxID=51671 RepID=UPI002C036E82|nr:nucleoside-diphosphate sugar epimerase/dehydratase [Microbacterium sp.]HWL78716.1 nucleoside-diphosphate sugar epimerase/dehydratase [Microbacterium sp.]